MAEKSMGAFFGYPQCCVDAFLDYDKRSSNSWFHGTGYIPCKECAKKPPYEILKSIEDNRVCKEPFPNGTTIDDYTRDFTDEYLNYLES